MILENLALHQQRIVQQRTIKRPKLKRKDRIFWAWLSRIWPEWKSALIVVKPENVIKWHRRGFKLYWRWKSRPSKVGRPRISKEIRDLISQMSRENPTWGAPRIQSELKLLGFEIADSTVAKYFSLDVLWFPCILMYVQDVHKALCPVKLQQVAQCSFLQRRMLRQRYVKLLVEHPVQETGARP